MNPLFSSRSKRIWAAGLFGVLFAGALTVLTWPKRQPGPAIALSSPTLPAESLPPVAPPVPKTAPSADPLAGVSGGVRLRPLQVARESNSYQWTVGDGRSDEVIGKLARNRDEYKRMVEENDRIKDRQLVYCKVTAAELVGHAQAQGATVREMALPGMNGQEYQFEIKQTDLAPSGQKGTFTGQLAGKGQSVVTLAYKLGREAFSVLSPEDNVYLEGESYEPGVMVVKSIDPIAYIPARCGNDDLARQNVPTPAGK